MRKACMKCVCKHLMQSEILHNEYLMGHEDFKWYIIGHLAEAADELVAKDPLLANTIREFRHQFTNYDGWFDIMNTINLVNNNKMEGEEDE